MPVIEGRRSHRQDSDADIEQEPRSYYSGLGKKNPPCNLAHSFHEGPDDASQHLLALFGDIGAYGCKPFQGDEVPRALPDFRNPMRLSMSLGGSLDNAEAGCGRLF